MNQDLTAAVDSLLPAIRGELEAMVRIPSVSAPAFDPAEVRRSAEHVADTMRRYGLSDARLLEIEGAHPAVFGHVAGPDDAPTVLLYAHHDVQPPGPDVLWTSAPFEPVERDGRLFGRGSSDDKAGIAVHLGAIAAHGSRPPVTVKVFVEGEEEIGSVHLPRFLDRYRDLLAADVYVIADSGNWRVGVPALTTSLRGLVDCVVEVRTLEKGTHSGQFGGAFADALTSLCRLLATLHDDAGNVAIEGLGGYPVDPLDLTEDELRSQAGALPGTQLIGTGTLTERTWTRPACSVLAIDSPPVAEAINQLLPSARAKVSVRIPPGTDPEKAMDALVGHLEANAPWGAEVTVTPGSHGAPIALSTDGAAGDAWRTGFAEAWGAPAVEIGVGGTIPFVAEFQEAYPEAAILLTGVADPTSRAHGPDESLDLADLRNGILAEAIALRVLAG
ncbi:MAG: dipeptidase [Actinomycetota bacterium]|nr:dipeptidase [Actinomycetota bacterium]